MAKITININTKRMNKEEITSSLTKIVDHIDSKKYDFGAEDGDLSFSVSKESQNLLPSIIKKE